MRVVCLVVVMSLVLSGCGDGIDRKNTITEQQAFDKVEDYIRQAMTALPEARLEALSPASSLSCEKHSTGGGQVTVGAIYWVRGIANEDRHFDAIVQWWETHDFVVREDSRPKSYRIFAENPKDGFSMAFSDNPKGELSIGVDSPCVA